MVKRILGNCYVYLILLLMYLPILVLIAYSFSVTDTIKFGPDGFQPGFDLYVNLFSNTAVARDIWIAVGNTVIIALISATISVLLGTFGAIGVFYFKKRSKRVVEGITQIPVANAEIVIALSLTVMFVFAGTYIFHTKLFSFWTLLIGHVVLSLPFVYLSVKPKLQQMDPSLYEAALDLGATPHQGLYKIIIPQILPGIISGFLLAVTLSLDDYIVTEFTRGSGLLSGEAAIETLSTYIQTSLKKHTVPPELRPLTLVIFLVVIGVVILTMFNLRMKQKIKERKERMAIGR